ncbi:Protein angel 2 [Mortierella alpina]|nr:Protein angel 2 [Mortierella alpina]
MKDSKYTRDVHVPNPLDWQLRRDLLLTEIEGHEADVVCVQELDAINHAGDFGDSMKHLGYKSIHQKRQRKHEHGFAVFFKNERITLVGSYAVPCLNSEIVNGIDSAGLLVVLDVTDEGKVQRVCVGTTHLVCNHTRGFKKLSQLVALTSAANVLMKRNPGMPLSRPRLPEFSAILNRGMNAFWGSLLIEYLLKGSVDLSEDFSREPFGKPSSMTTQRHRLRVKAFKKETWALRGLVPPKASAYPPSPRTLAAPAPSTFAPKVEELRHMIKTHRDLEDDVVAHPLHLTSVYDVPNIPDFIFHGEIMGYSRRLELVARLVLPDMLLQLKSGLPAAHLGSDHLAIGAQYRFRD